MTKSIKIELSDGKYYTLNEIVKKFNVSRSTAWRKRNYSGKEYEEQMELVHKNKQYKKYNCGKDGMLTFNEMLDIVSERSNEVVEENMLRSRIRTIKVTKKFDRMLRPIEW